MSSQKIKFSMSVKELSFTFEGDVDTGQRIQAGIVRTLSNLTKQQERLLPGFEEEPVPLLATPVEENASPKKSRSPRKSRPKGTSPRALIVALRSEGYFDQKRDAGLVQGELEKRGRKFTANAISPALLALTQKDILTREKNGDGVYEYIKGPNDDVGGDSEGAE